VPERERVDDVRRRRHLDLDGLAVVEQLERE
jgi:hypothetical protein